MAVEQEKGLFAPGSSTWHPSSLIAPVPSARAGVLEIAVAAVPVIADVVVKAIATEQ